MDFQTVYAEYSFQEKLVADVATRKSQIHSFTTYFSVHRAGYCKRGGAALYPPMPLLAPSGLCPAVPIAETRRWLFQSHTMKVRIIKGPLMWLNGKWEWPRARSYISQWVRPAACGGLRTARDPTILRVY